MFNSFNGQKVSGKEYKFSSSYGFALGLETKKSSYPQLVQKAISLDANAEIYKIGAFTDDSCPKVDIFVLIWNSKVIPFLVPPPLLIAQKTFLAYVTRLKRDVCVAEYQIPMTSVVAIDIGKDLKELPRGRDHNAHYERCVFEEKENHSYEFTSNDDDALALIRRGLPVLLYDRYDHGSYSPLISSEIIFGIGPWNFEEDLYNKEMCEFKNSYGSEYRKVYAIQSRIDAAKEAEETSCSFSETSAFSSFLPKGADKLAKRVDNNAEKTVAEWIKELNRTVKTAKDLIHFIETHPKPRQAGAAVRIGDLQQDDKNRELLFEYLISSDLAVIKKFNEYKKELGDSAAKTVDQHTKRLECCPVWKPTIDEFLKEQFSGNSKMLSIEEIMMALIESELPYHHTNEWRHGSGFNTNILKHPLFLELVQELYHEHYEGIVPSYGYFLVVITEIMVRRISMRAARERTETI
jgi:hypothetical protein